MEPASEARRRLESLDQPRGAGRRVLEIGDWQLLITGLDPSLAEALDRRWGGFLRAGQQPPRAALSVVRGGGRRWLEPRAGEPYRVEAGPASGSPLVRSYNFAMTPDRKSADVGRASCWRVAVSESQSEPLEQTVENALRYLLARVAVERGGFALHAAGVLRDERAYLFGGPSGAGKSTVVSLSAPSPGLGDDYAVVTRRDGAWFAAAVPFDNSGSAPADPPRGWLPLAGVWRLYQAEEDRTEKAPPSLAVASLMSCVALPWAMPDLSDTLLRQLDGLVADGLFAHLRFRRAPDFWQKIVTTPRD